MTQIISRRTFLKQLSGCVASAALANVMRPSFLLAQGSPGAFKNIIEIFCYGGYDARFLFPYFAGEVDQEIRARRMSLNVPVSSPNPANNLIQYAGFNQTGRVNPVGFHPRWKDLLDYAQSNPVGLALIEQFGITHNRSFSHEVAQKHYRNASTAPNNQVTQGFLGRLLDATGLPGMAVWGFDLEGEQTFMHTDGDNRAMMVSNLSSLLFTDRSFSTSTAAFNCAGVVGANCIGGGDWATTGQDDSLYAREIMRRLYENKTEEMPLADAANAALRGLNTMIPVVEQISTQQVRPEDFRHPSRVTSPTTFSANLADLMKTLRYLNSPAADHTVRSGTKIFAVPAALGWDSHASQNATIPLAIETLASGIRGIVGHLLQTNLLSESLIVVYSEFGRTTRENGSQGTDHAGASTALIVGEPARVRAGVYGPDPVAREAREQNFFTPQVALNGVLRQIYGHAGLSKDQIDRVFAEKMPGEVTLPFLA